VTAHDGVQNMDLAAAETTARELARRFGLAITPAGTADVSGWDFLVFHAVDDDGTRWIIRVPRRPDLTSRLASEEALLRLAARRLAVPVPDWRLRHGSAVGYPLLPGVPAATEDPVTLRYHWPTGLPGPASGYVSQVAAILAALHAVPPTEIASAGLPMRRISAVQAAMSRRLARVRTRVGIPTACDRRWSAWLADPGIWPRQAALTHGDLHPGHTLITEAGAISGIIDWTNGGYGDPAADFVDLCYAGGTGLLDLILNEYGRHGGHIWPTMRDHILMRVSFIWAGVADVGLLRRRPAYLELARQRMAEMAGQEWPDGYS